MSNEEKVRRLERLAAEKTSAAQDAKFVFAAEGLVAEFTADADILREAAQLMREQESLMTGPDWKLMYEAQKRDMAAMRKRIAELEAVEAWRRYDAFGHDNAAWIGPEAKKSAETSKMLWAEFRAALARLEEK